MRGFGNVVGQRLRKTIAVTVGAAALAASAAGNADAAGAPKGASPFRAATVQQTSSHDYVVSWKARAAHVRVIATNSPDATQGNVVGTGDGNDRVVVRGLSPDTRWYFRLTTNGGRSVVVAERSLELASAPNARDAGGYRTTDGRWFEPGRVYRTSALAKLSPEELKRLESLGITQVIDLRTPSEISDAPDPQLAGAASVSYPVIADDDPSTAPYFASTPQAARAAFDALGGPGGDFRLFYVGLAMPNARNELQKVFAALVAANGKPVLIHCSAGQDRTGVVLYVLDRILGVSSADAMRDYMLSKRNNASASAAYVPFFTEMGYSRAEALEGVEVSPRAIRSTLRVIDMMYGSFDNYVRQGLGLSSSEVEQLRSAYLSARGQ